MSGLLVVLEGGEGTGKTTQQRLLGERLRARGADVLLTREPGGSTLGQHLRPLLLDTGGQVSPRAEALLYAADRAEHADQVLRPALARGAVVVCDRHADSSVAYQGAGRGLGRAAVAALSAFATDGLRPDLVVVLDGDPAAGLGRAAGRGAGVDRLEAEDLAFHVAVRESFLLAAQQHPERYAVVGVDGHDAAQVAREVAALVDARLGRRLPVAVDGLPPQGSAARAGPDR